MSSGIEVLLLAPLLLPMLTGSGAVIAGGAAATGAAATGGVVVTGSSVVTTSAFATGSIAAGGGAATAATGAAVVGGAVMVVGVAGAALLAARYLHGAYQSALTDYQRRIEEEQADFQAALRVEHNAAEAALFRAQKTRVKAAESAEIAFLRASAQRLQKRLGDWPGSDPRWPSACQQLLQELEGPNPQLAELFGTYETLNVMISNWIRTQSAQLDASALTSSHVKESYAAIEAEIAALRDDITGAPPEVLNDNVRADLTRLLAQVEHLLDAQPKMAEQGLKLLCGRVGRELALGAAHAIQKRQEQEKFSALLRELAGRISARSQATLAVLESEELASSSVARTQLSPIQTQAMTNLQRLATHLVGELPTNLAPLEKLALEADALFETTADQLRQIALQIYLESQVREVFTQLGYRVTTVEDPLVGTAQVMAALGGERAVEVRLDGQGNMVSELVALSPGSTEIEPHAQEKVCDLMDEVFELLRARGCGVREKKRRHFKKGERALRLVHVSTKKAATPNQSAAPANRQISE